MIMLLLVIHSIFTPLIVTSFTTSYQWALPVTFLPVFGMFALNQVAAQLEMPFGTDDNDLPLTHFQYELNKSLLQLMHEMSDHLPSTLKTAKTSVDDLRTRGLPSLFGRKERNKRKEKQRWSQRLLCSRFLGGSQGQKGTFSRSSSKAFESMDFEEEQLELESAEAEVATMYREIARSMENLLRLARSLPAEKCEGLGEVKHKGEAIVFRETSERPFEGIKSV
eukprot:g5071.t1